MNRKLCHKEFYERIVKSLWGVFSFYVIFLEINFSMPSSVFGIKSISILSL